MTVAKSAMIAMSGGVDSSVAALLAIRAGYDCTGVTMRLFDNEDIGIERESTCCSLSDIEDARSICNKLGIPYYVFNFTDTFAEQVIDRFINDYENGRTPNPCIDCNRYLKFDRLLKRAQETNFDYVITGHYVRREYDEASGRYLLKRGLDHNKDQSYVLYGMTQEQLAHTLFPLGELTKHEVRDIAREQGFLTAEKSESQDICFVPDRDYGAFIRHYTGKQYPGGDIVDDDGAQLGSHSGIIDFTVGQRKGLGVAVGHPLYVTALDPKSATVFVGEEEGLLHKTAVLEDVNLIACASIEGELECTAKHRYRSVDKPVTVTQSEGASGEVTLTVTFDEPQKAITSGQALVLYNGDVVIGGGTIGEVM
ncbi:MAG TPA: tRNA 2-thiouridine(34) synthase MnmA [Coriobacteriia bacterium]|nr:tRNA 2-thiouridine(34) synthase MnmA [Coriobacteriia bacterium]